jgi:prepilin-type processing-associated H-X9-DG protein
MSALARFGDQVDLVNLFFGDGHAAPLVYPEDSS